MKAILYIILLTTMLCSSGCGFLNQEDSKDKEIKNNFQKMLNLYPTKNLEDFYDKEGYRDEEFDKDDKGTWIIQSKMVIQKKKEKMISRGITLHINRNKKKANGDFVVRETTENSKGRPEINEKNIQLKWNIIELFQRNPLKMTS